MKLHKFSPSNRVITQQNAGDNKKSPWNGRFKNSQILGFSAIYDDRHVWSQRPVIVVMGIIEVNIRALSWMLWYKNNGIKILKRKWIICHDGG